MSDTSRVTLYLRRYVDCVKLAYNAHVKLVLYAVGIVELELESTSALILLLFIVWVFYLFTVRYTANLAFRPLAFTLSGFLMWIMYSLNGMEQPYPQIIACLMNILATIAHLRARKQRFKLSMFTRLYHILLFAVAVIISFFFVSFWSFSDRLAEG